MTKLCPFMNRIRRSVDARLETESQPRCLRDECGLWVGDAIDGGCAFVIAVKTLETLAEGPKKTTLQRWVE